ncbi:MAG: cell division protein FtsQ/DivIB [Xanthobacteraceae bacterium]|nr:MAG: cell division protein FtsQ/DivIB [Xanthobacteraceae bacterium]
MDGGGRLARSLKEPGQTAGTGAGRAVNARPRGRVRDHSAELPQHGLIRSLARIERRLPRGFGVAATAAMLLVSAGYGAVRGDHLGAVTAVLRDARDAAANAAGFRIADVAVAGRRQLTQDEVLAIGGVTARQSLLFLDAAAVRDRLKANPWIADATVLKLFPNRLQIDITERAGFALWQVDGQVSVIAEDGAVLETPVPRRFTGLPLVVGKGANLQVRDFLATLAYFPKVKEQVKAMVLVGERRWNLRLANGLDVRLPEINAAGALTRLTRLDQDERLFTRDITAIDLRLPDRVTVRLSEDAAKARADVLKAKFPKRKAGDA